MILIHTLRPKFFEFLKMLFKIMVVISLCYCENNLKNLDWSPKPRNRMLINSINRKRYRLGIGN